MVEDRFFDTTRGKILSLLRKSNEGLTVDELSHELAITSNAVRQQIALLEGGHFVSGRRVKRGATKPSVVYFLTSEGDNLFPKHYDALLNSVLREILREDGPEKVERIFQRIGENSAERYAPRFAGKSLDKQVDELSKILEENGAVVEYEKQADGGYIVREHSCPYIHTSTANPQVCTLVQTMMVELLDADVVQDRSLANGHHECRFQIHQLSEEARPLPVGIISPPHHSVEK